MTQFHSELNQDMNDTACRVEYHAPEFGVETSAWPNAQSETAIHLDSCAPFERLAVKTRASMYEVIVLAGCTGEVLIRGGRFFPEFRRAILAGSTAGGSALRLRTIDVGLRMELCDDLKRYTTTPVDAVARMTSLFGGDVAAQVP